MAFSGAAAPGCAFSAAYDVGTYELNLNDPQGNPTTVIGKYVVVWKKQPGKQWKAVADIFNPDN